MSQMDGINYKNLYFKINKFPSLLVLPIQLRVEGKISGKKKCNSFILITYVHVVVQKSNVITSPYHIDSISRPKFLNFKYKNKN